MKVSEPTANYGVSNIQGLKNRIIASIDKTDDEGKLQECLEVLTGNDIPCVYSDEEFENILMEAEASGYASEEEVKAMFAKWKL